MHLKRVQIQVFQSPKEKVIQLHLNKYKPKLKKKNFNTQQERCFTNHKIIIHNSISIEEKWSM